MDPAKAAEVIRTHVDVKAPMTVADAAAATGLALRDAESGLTWLSKEYRGQLRVTSEGQLVHVFPTGFTRPWAAHDARERILHAVGGALMSVLRFVVRAWVCIVLLGYAAIFIALIFGMAFARQSNDSRRSGNDLPGGALAYGLMRVIGDALFWTFHPWSPFSVVSGYGDGWNGGSYAAVQRARSRGPRVPMYERVNRFFFGPNLPPEDPLDNDRRVLAAIRAGKGRIGLADVMRVTGLGRDLADPLMAKLMLDYQGDVAVSEDGGIVYRFPEIRKTASETEVAEPSPAWSRIKPLPPLTGNPLGANVAIAGINAFNMLMGMWVIQNNLTIERASHLFDRIPQPIYDTGTPIALGVIPLVFSALLFVMPVARAIGRPLRVRHAAQERGRLALLRVVLERLRAKQPVTDGTAQDAWKAATGSEVPVDRLNQELVALGGKVQVDDDGQSRWRFADFETEATALAAERQAAAEDEAQLGEVVFATDRH
jgi:hypothetical protein